MHINQLRNILWRISKKTIRKMAIEFSNELTEKKDETHPKVDSSEN